MPLFLLLFFMFCPNHVMAQNIKLPFYNKAGKITAHLTGRTNDLMLGSAEIRKTSKGYILYCKEPGIFSLTDPGKVGDIKTYRNTSFTKIVDSYGSEKEAVQIIGTTPLEGLRVDIIRFQGIEYIYYSKDATIIEIKLDQNYSYKTAIELVCNYDYLQKFKLSKPKIKSVKRKKNKITVKIKKQKKVYNYSLLFYNKKKKLIENYDLDTDSTKITFDRRDYWRAKYIAVIAENLHFTSKRSKLVKIR